MIGELGPAGFVEAVLQEERPHQREAALWRRWLARGRWVDQAVAGVLPKGRTAGVSHRDGEGHGD